MKAKESFTFKRGLKIKNRTVMPPMTTKMSFYNGVVTEDEIAYYQKRAGEVGMMITGAANVQENGKTWEGELSVSNDHMIAGLSKLAAGMKVNGTKAILQIFHGGRRSSTSVLRGVQPVSAGNIPAIIPGSEVPRPLTEEEILQTIENFKLATQRAIKAGFDGVEIHGANTYLLQQFFSPHSNNREDKWGGSLANRFLFIEKVVDAVIAAVEEEKVENFIVGYRFSPEEYETPGIRMKDTFYLIDHLVEKELDYLHISLNDYKRVAKEKEFKEKSILEYVNERINGRLPLISVGNVRNLEDMEKALENSDLVAIGTGLLFDPHFVGKALSGNSETIFQTLSLYDRDVFKISDGVLGFLEGRAKNRLTGRKSL